VHHSDRGVQYASRGYAALLEKHQMVASMSRAGNPYDNARCERFMRTLKQEEIKASAYRDLQHLRENLGDFLDSITTENVCTRRWGIVPRKSLNESKTKTRTQP
jgi:transposase InsO family protein